MYKYPKRYEDTILDGNKLFEMAGKWSPTSWFSVCCYLLCVVYQSADPSARPSIDESCGDQSMLLILLVFIDMFRLYYWTI